MALGDTASQTILTNAEGITSARVGPPKRTENYPYAQIIPTVHPAFCLRNGDQFPHFVSDLGKAVTVSHTAWKPPTLAVFDDVLVVENVMHFLAYGKIKYSSPTYFAGQAVEAIKELRAKYRDIVVDIECGIEKDSEYDHPDHYQMLCIGFSYAPGKAIVIGEEALQRNDVREALGELFGDENKNWIAHNGKFDLAALQSWGMGTRLFFDTMLASYALDERQGTHGLKYLAVEVLGAPHYDAELTKYIGKGADKDFTKIPRDILYKYNAYDVGCTWDLYEYYTKELEKEKVRELHDFLCVSSMQLMLAEMAGVGVDMSYLDVLDKEILTEHDEIEALLHPWVLNPRSPKQVKETLAELRIVVESTNADTLEHLQDRLDQKSEAYEFITRMLQYRKVQKLYGTYIKGTRKRIRRGRVHTSFLLHGTTTGRLSSRNPNLQNVPRGSRLRSLFVPGPGNVFVQADYGQIELRVAAILSRDEYLHGVFNDDSRDLFDELGLELHGPKALGPNRKEIRIHTKAYVYGVNYGRSAFDIAREYRIPEWEAQQGIDTFFKLAQGMYKWRQDTINSILNDKDDLVTPFGRRRRFWLITRENKQDTIKQGLAFIPQSTASDVNLTAANRLRLDYGLDVRILVHDSTLVECKEEDAEHVSAIMSAVMTQTAVDCLGDYVKFPVEASIGKSWGVV